MINLYGVNFNNKEPEPLLINKKLLYDYKEQGDVCLVNIKRELTRSLVDYKLFQQLQQINNDFFIIVDYLDCEHYFKVAEVIKDKNILKNDLDDFIVNCKSNIGLDIFETIDEDCKELMIVIQKLVTIVSQINKQNF